MPWQENPDKAKIINELLSGVAPYSLGQKYPAATVYRYYNQLRAEGRLGDGVPTKESKNREDGIDKVDFNKPPIISVPVAPPSNPKKATFAGRTTATVPHEKAEKIDMSEFVQPDSNAGGAVTYDIQAVNRIRGILGIQARPKVLAMPMPELLYPAMVIATTELGFPMMTPDNFIDTVLYQWLEACDYVPFMYVKKSEVGEIVRRDGILSDDELIDMVKARGINPYVVGGNGSNDSPGRTEPTGAPNLDVGREQEATGQDETGANSGAEGGSSSTEIFGSGTGEDGLTGGE